MRRWFGPAAGLLAGAVMALTPVATLIFRFNNPDALLTLLLVAGAYAVVRALEGGATRWLVLAGACVGLGFLAKQLQALLVVPAFALVYLAAAPGSLGRRLGQLVAAGAAMVASAGWWVAIVELLPASARPYIGGSQTNSILELTFGYNGLGRLTGDETGSVGGGPGGGWGQTGWTRMFGAEVGGQVAWLLPAALLLLAAGLWLTRRAPRTNRARAAFALWGGWLVVTGAVFSFMQGIFHAYYAVALAPAVGALVGMGATGLWEVRRSLVARWWLAGTVAVTAVWSWVLLRRTPDWHPELAPLVLLGGLAVAALIAAVPWQGPASSGWAGRGGRRMAAAVAGAGLLVALAGPAAYSLDTAATPHGGAIPSAGPAVQGGGPGGGPRGGGFRNGGGPPPGFGRDGGGPFGQAAPGGPGGTGPWRGRRAGRHGRPARRRHARRRAGRAAAAGRRPLHLGRGRGRVELGRRGPAGHRRARHGHRRLQRQRPRPHPRAVPAVRGRGQDPLVPWRRPHGRPVDGRQRRRPADQRLGRGQLHRDQRRRGHRLRPDRRDRAGEPAPHHQPWCFAQRSSVPEMAAMTSSTTARCQKSVASLAMMFIP